MNLNTTYMGLELDHPIVASASPLSHKLDGIRRLEDGGAAAIVLFSLFEEQLNAEQQAYDHLTDQGAESFSAIFPRFPTTPPGRTITLRWCAGPERPVMSRSSPA